MTLPSPESFDKPITVVVTDDAVRDVCYRMLDEMESVDDQTWRALRSAMQAALSLIVMPFVATKVQDGLLPGPAPDMRCSEAKQNLMSYSTRYLVNLMLRLAVDEKLYATVSGAEDEHFFVTGILSASTELGTQETTGNSGNGDPEAGTT